MSAPGNPRRGWRSVPLRWRLIALVTLGTILNYLARSTLSVAAPQLKTEFGMSTEDYSWVVLAFQASYTVMQTVAGSVLDLLGTRLGFFLFAVGWALANGRYTVELSFVEPALAAGARQFDVVANGKRAIAALDIAAVAGAPLTRVTRRIVVGVTDGMLDLKFVPIKGDAIVSGIEITR